VAAVTDGPSSYPPTCPSADQTQLIIWSCHGGTNQRWTLP
jgi:hypothetical protein